MLSVTAVMYNIGALKLVSCWLFSPRVAHRLGYSYNGKGLPAHNELRPS